MKNWSSTKVLALVATAVCCSLYINLLPWLCSGVVLTSLLAAALFRVPVLPQVLVTAATILAVAGGYFAAGGSKDAGLAVIVLLACQKLFDLRGRRDLAVLLALNLFLLAAAMGGLSNTVAPVLGFFVVIVVVLCQVFPEPAEAGGSLRVRLGVALRAIMLGAPVTLALMMILPVQGLNGVIGRPGGGGGAVAGLGDTLAPGDIATLSDSPNVAFLAKFDGQVPPVNSLYWRAEVLSDYDGSKWFRALESTDMEVTAAARMLGPARLAVFGIPITYTVIMEPSGRTWIPALGAVTEISAGIKTLHPTVTDDLLVRTGVAAESTVAYQFKSYRDYKAPLAVRTVDTRRHLALPSGRNPRTVDLGRALREREKSPEATLSAALRYLRDNKFVYTRKPGLMRGDQVDVFLFDRKAGFCEHYASAFAVLMRAAGIPARVVLGYHGGERGESAEHSYLVVMQSHAHAWVEVMMPGRGWVQVDPTTQAELEPASGVAAIASMLWGNSPGPAWLLKLPESWQPRKLDAMTLAVVVVVAIVIGLLIAGLMWWRWRKTVDPVQRLYEQLEQKMAKRGYPRALHEGPATYAKRLSETLPQDQASPVCEFLSEYGAIRYGRPQDDEKEAVRKLRRLYRRAAPMVRKTCCSKSA